MPSKEAEAIKAEIRAAGVAPYKPVTEARRAWEKRAAGESLPEGTKVSPVKAGGVLAEWIEHPDCEAGSDAVFVWLHGGAYALGSPATHRKLAAYLSQATRMRVLLPDYRLAPEDPFPAGVHDCLEVYGALLSEGIAARRIALGGDSAGGGLAASMLLSLKEVAGPMPSSLTMIGPWLDLSNSSDAYTANIAHHAGASLEKYNELARWYVGEADPQNPIISPMFAELRGLPPVHIQVSDKEVFTDDSRKFAANAEKAKVPVELDVQPDLWHVWHQHVPNVPEAIEGIETIGRFVRRHLGA